MFLHDNCYIMYRGLWNLDHASCIILLWSNLNWNRCILALKTHVIKSKKHQVFFYFNQESTIQSGKRVCNKINHNYNKILKSDWLLTVLNPAPKVMLHGMIRNNVAMLEQWCNHSKQCHNNVAMLEQWCNHSKQCHNNVAMLCCAKIVFAKRLDCNITLI